MGPPACFGGDGHCEAEALISPHHWLPGCQGAPRHDKMHSCQSHPCKQRPFLHIRHTKDYMSRTRANSCPPSLLDMENILASHTSF